VNDDLETPLASSTGELPADDDTLGAAPGKRRVLVVDDYSPSADGLVEHLETWGFSARAAYSAEQAIAAAEEFDPELVVSDLVMPGADGIQLLERLRAQNLDVEFLMLTGQGTIETAKEAIQKGAFDYLTKPVDPAHLRHLLTLASERLESRRTMFRLRRVLQSHGWYDALVGDSGPMVELKRTIEQVAPSAASVMITGESGTGKELVARTLHRRSPRASQPFIPINCAAIPENLLESELFGHEKGAFTGAVAMRQGCFELAHGGTVFLDEIGEMPALLQAKLLRALEERAFRRVGGTQEVQVDVRVIAATNRDLEGMIREGTFRQDLYYRLNVFPLRVPPLRERGEDVEILARAFSERGSARLGRPIAPLTAEDVAKLRRYEWPGNVRELQNVMERAVITACEGRLNLKRALPEPTASAEAAPGILTIAELEVLERRSIEAALDAAGGKVSGPGGAAERLGVPASTLSSRLKALGLRRE
jgi:DNA-binding NtrC family response regulator